MPPVSRNLLNLTVAGALTALLTSLVLGYLFMRLGDEPAVFWTSRAAYGFATVLVVALAFGHLGRATGQGAGSCENQ